MMFFCFQTFSYSILLFLPDPITDVLNMISKNMGTEPSYRHKLVCAGFLNGNVGHFVFRKKK
jgi:hypothetical protein